MPLQRMKQHILPRIRGVFQRNKWLSIGVLGAVLAFIGSAGLHVVSIPWLVTADAPFHFDYVWQIYQGTLPEFAEGPIMPVDISIHYYHLAGHHPPLYYAILAPILGPFIAEGNWEVAAGVGRLMTLGIGVLSLLALAGVGWLVGGQYRRMLAVTAPAIAATFGAFILVASGVYSDTLLVLMTTLAFGLSVLVLYRGPRWWYLACLALVLLMGMATRVAFASMFGLALVAVVAAFIIHGKDKIPKNALKGVGYAAIMALITVAGIGWFYYFHNFEASGSFLTHRPDWVEHARRYQSFSTVITSRDLWYLVPFGFFGHSLHRIDDFVLNQWLSYIVFLAGFSGVIVWSVKQKAWRLVSRTNTASVAVTGMFITYFGLVFTQQIVYATGHGMYNFRYLLPAWVVFGIMLGFGLLVWRQRGLVVMFAAILGWIAVIHRAIYILTVETNLSTDQGWLHLLQSGALHNGFHPIIVPAMLVVTAVGLILTGVSLWRLAPHATETPDQARDSN